LALFPDKSLWYGTKEMLVPLGLIAFLVTAGVALFNIFGQSDLPQVEWTFEWWFTFPAPARALLLARVLETAIASPFAWFVLCPFFTVVYVCAGFGWAGLPMGVIGTLYAGVLCGAFRIVCEVALPKLLSFAAVARVQAACSVLASLAFVAAVAATTGTWWLTALDGLAHRLPTWAWVNPLSPLAFADPSVRLAAAVAWPLFAFCAAEASARLGEWWLRDGLSTGGAPQGTRRRARRLEGDGPSGAWTWAAVARKELRFVVRNRVVLAQVVVAPAMIAGVHFIVNPSLAGILVANPRHLSALAFGVGCIVLMNGACRALAAETPTLWIYYTVPRALDRVLVDKAIFWSGLAALLSSVTFAAVVVATSMSIGLATPYLLLVLVGVVIQSFIATALGVLGTDAFDTEPTRRVSAAMLYLFMLLSTTFAYALYVPSVWAKGGQIALSGLLVLALGQKVRDHAPYLLDPNEAPPPRVEIADGVMAALAFFVGQGLLVLLVAPFGWSPGASLVFAFSGAGLVVTVTTVFLLWRGGVPNVFAALGLRAPMTGAVRGILEGLVGGSVGALAAQGYLRIVDRMPLLHRLREQTVGILPSDVQPASLPWVVGLTVIAAPLFEEIMFRSILDGGFRRPLRPLHAALASALVFAVVHPAIAALPVFVLGVIAAIVYERSRFIGASIVTHMTYNAVVVSLALRHA